MGGVACRDWIRPGDIGGARTLGADRERQFHARFARRSIRSV